MHKTMINVINSFWGSSGYSSHGRSLCNALNKLTKVKISTNLMPGWEIQVNDAELEMIKREEDFEINLIITHPLNWKVHLNAKRNFVYLIWEGDKIPKWMILECLNPKIEKIIVPSEHTKQAVLNTLKELFIPELTPVLGALILTEYSFKREEYEKDINNKIITIPHGHNPEDFYQIVSDKKDETPPNSHLETRSKPEEENTDVKTGDVDNHADNPRDDSRNVTSADKEDTGDGTFPVDFKSKG